MEIWEVESVGHILSMMDLNLSFVHNIKQYDTYVPIYQSR
jgi:hypothetical protein